MSSKDEFDFAKDLDGCDDTDFEGETTGKKMFYL